MSLMLGFQMMRARRVKVAEALTTEGFRLGAVGVVHSIASVIQNQGAIKTDRTVRSAFNKLESAAMNFTGKNNPVSFTDDEVSVFKQLGELAKEGVNKVAEIVGGNLFRVFGQAVRLAIIPVFSIFCTAISTVFRTILMNPYGLAATAVIAAALGARKAWMNNRESQYRGSDRERGPDLPGVAFSGNQRFNAPVPKNAEDKRVQEVVANAAKRNGVPVDLALRVATIESSMNPKAGSSTSSAKGLFGITSATWVGLGGKPGEENDAEKNADLGTKYLASNYKGLKKALGREVATYEVYATHHFGPGVAKLLAVQDSMSGKTIEEGLALFNSDARVKLIMQQNPYLRGKTVGQVLNELKAKTGDYSMAKAQTLDEYHDKRIQGMATGSFALPTSGTFTSPFGQRSFRGPMGGIVHSDHKGIDIANSVGTPIYAADAGVVTVASVASAGYGTRVDIDHGNGFLTRYGHSSRLLVKEGDRVSRGQHIAAMGNAGFSSGPHLHFEVRTITASGDSRPVDPALYLPLPDQKNATITPAQVSQSAQHADKQYIKVAGKMVALNGG